VRSAQIVSQRNNCDLCGLPGVSKDPVLDHCHTTGAVRGTLHRSCNSLLGKVENNAARFGVKSLPAFLHGCAGYLQKHATNITGMLHPTHLTDDEKRIKRNRTAVKKRAALRKPA
jgi:hypothetical protein